MKTTAPGSNPSSASTYSDGALHTASSNAHAAVDSITGYADEAARKVKPAIDSAAGYAHHAVDRAAGAAAPAAEWLSEQGESLKHAQKKLMHDTSGYISTNPLTAVVLAVAAGFVISRIIR